MINDEHEEITEEISTEIPLDMALMIAADHGHDLDVIRSVYHSYAEVGYAASQFAGSKVSTEKIEMVIENGTSGIGDVFTDKTTILTSELEGVAVGIEDFITANISDPNSTLAQHLEMILNQIQVLIENMGNTDLTTSLASKIAYSTSEEVATVRALIAEALDISIPDSLASKMLAKQLEYLLIQEQNLTDLAAKIEAEQDKLALAIGYKDLQQEEDKGKNFQDLVAEKLISIAGRHGDSSEDRGNKTDGIGLSKKGDNLVKVILAETEIGRMAVEVKAGKITMTGKKSVQAELTEAMEVNEATVGISICDLNSAPKVLQNEGILTPQPGMYILGIDRHEPKDFRALSLLYRMVRLEMISRYMQEQKHVDTIMPDEIVALCKAGQAELASIKKVMKNLKQASDINLNCRKELSDHLDDMTTRFRAIEFAVQSGKSDAEDQTP